jgi:hypothetical protein
MNRLRTPAVLLLQSSGVVIGSRMRSREKTNHMSLGCFKARPRYHFRWAIPDCDPIRPSMLRCEPRCPSRHRGMGPAS